MAYFEGMCPMTLILLLVIAVLLAIIIGLRDEKRELRKKLRDARCEIEDCKLRCMVQTMRRNVDCPFPIEPDLADDETSVAVYTKEGATHVESD